MGELEGHKKETTKTLVLGVIGADVHVIGIKILEHSLSLEGFNVVNIGVMSSQEDFINAALETDADAILVSSLYGHGELDCQGLKDKCIEVGLDDILLYAGGNLVVGRQLWEEVEKRFQDIGFNRVYPPGTLPETAISHLKQDLGLLT